MMLVSDKRVWNGQVGNLGGSRLTGMIAASFQLGLWIELVTAR